MADEEKKKKRSLKDLTRDMLEQQVSSLSRSPSDLGRDIADLSSTVMDREFTRGQGVAVNRGGTSAGVSRRRGNRIDRRRPDIKVGKIDFGGNRDNQRLFESIVKRANVRNRFSRDKARDVLDLEQDKLGIARSQVGASLINAQGPQLISQRSNRTGLLDSLLSLEASENTRGSTVVSPQLSGSDIEGEINISKIPSEITAETKKPKKKRKLIPAIAKPLESLGQEFRRQNVGVQLFEAGKAARDFIYPLQN